MSNFKSTRTHGSLRELFRKVILSYTRVQAIADRAPTDVAPDRCGGRFPLPRGIEGSDKYVIRSPAKVALNVRIPSSPAQQLISERWKISPRARSDLIVPEPDCNRFDQLWVVEDSDLTIRYEAEVEVRHQLLNPNAFGRFPSSERC